MNRIRIFFGFWRKFIVGDDARIAIAVMWVMLFVKSLANNSMNTWLVVPIAVLILLIYLTYDVLKRAKGTTNISIFWVGLVPMIFSATVPTLLFRINTGATDMQFTYIPITICIIVSVFATIILRLVLSHYPILLLFLLGYLTLGLVTFWRVDINSFSYIIIQRYAVIGNFLTVLTIAGFVASCCYNFRFSSRNTLKADT